MRQRVWTAGVAATTVWILSAWPATADQLSRGVQDITVMDNGAGEQRVLFRLDAPLELSGVAVRSAVLTFPVAGLPADRVLRLQLSAVSREWSPGSVDWEAGWDRPGGDYHDQLYSRADLDLSRGDRQVTFNVTSILKEMVEMSVPVHGLLLMVEPRRGDGIRSEDLERFNGLASARLTVHYRGAPPGPRGRAATG